MRYFVLYLDFRKFLNIQRDNEMSLLQRSPYVCLLQFSAGTPPHAATEFALVSCHAAYCKCQKLSDMYCRVYLCVVFPHRLLPITF